MSRQSTVMVIANRMAKAIVADQTRIRLAIGFDAAIIAANEVFHMGPGRAAAFANAYNEALNELADLFIRDVDENGDRNLEYAKGKRDEKILKIVGEENFAPFEKVYGGVYIDELMRVRSMTQ